jgi:hypothetical protein
MRETQKTQETRIQKTRLTGRTKVLTETPRRKTPMGKMKRRLLKTQSLMKRTTSRLPKSLKRRLLKNYKLMGKMEIVTKTKRRKKRTRTMTTKTRTKLSLRAKVGEKRSEGSSMTKKKS